MMVIRPQSPASINEISASVSPSLKLQKAQQETSRMNRRTYFKTKNRDFKGILKEDLSRKSAATMKSLKNPSKREAVFCFNYEFLVGEDKIFRGFGGGAKITIKFISFLR